MHAGQVALAAARGRQPAAAADREELAAPALFLQATQQVIQADTVTADHDQIGGLNALREQMYLHALSSFEILPLARDDHEAIRPAERGDGARAFAHRIRDQARFARSVLAADESDEEIFRPPTFGIDAQ